MMYSIFIANFLLLNWFFYILETFKFFFMPDIVRCFVFGMMIVISYFFSCFLSKNSYKSFFQSYKTYYAIFLTALYYFLFKEIPGSIPDDELFRLGAANAMVHNNFPLDRSWYIAGSSGKIGYYMLPEYISVNIYCFVLKIFSLETCYLHIYRFIIRFSIILITLNILDSVNLLIKEKTRLSFNRISIIAIHLLPFFMLLPPFPLYTALAHLTYKGSISGLFAFILSIQLLMELQKINFKIDRLKYLFLSSLIFSIPGIVYTFKTQFAVVLLFAILLFYVVDSLVNFNKHRIILVILSGIPGLFFLLLDYYSHPMFKNIESSLIYSPGWIFYQTSHIFFNIFGSNIFSVAVETGMIGFILLPIFFLLYKSKISRLGYFFILYCLSGALFSFFLGSLFRITPASGNAELYWLIAGWYFMTLFTMVVFSLIVISSNYLSIVSVFLLASIGWFYTTNCFNKILQRYSLNPEKGREICQYISKFYTKNDENNKYYAIAYLEKDISSVTDEMIINAYCPYSTITMRNPRGGISEFMAHVPNWQDSKTSNFILAKPEEKLLNEAVKYLIQHNIKKIFIISKNNYDAKYYYKKIQDVYVIGPINIEKAQ